MKYWSDDFFNKLKEKYGNSYQEITKHAKEDESKLLRSLDIESKLELAVPKISKKSALFGYNSLRADYIPNNKSKTIVEFKKIGLESKNGTDKKNECEIKNGLSQIIEQAICLESDEAVLVIIDGGRVASRQWNNTEINFIKMFQSNPFDIKLSVIRVRVIDPIKFEYYKPFYQNSKLHNMTQKK